MTATTLKAADGKTHFPYLPAIVKCFQNPDYLKQMVADPIGTLKSDGIAVDDGVGIKITMDGTSAGGNMTIYVTNAGVNWHGQVNLSLSA
ncbi:hypothetical protein [Mucilaginibacter phyllosphaerae]|uniref:Uncharacterized protein n=1 Tax=Mucilaginibacter phyllosphaerae TaxID=1812349 RepID=A0A4Y8AHN2_9SPHI|nr:hypothetical protein [Mucilaginibacter phyllosphaerae]MBB3968725.1 hypothetical protein [Mucilaginibacter phyllosphaerae]TEW67639.1 hypothetical protein E2R65_06520 [Mucilaginibacter phyllosphaerae]GGH14274.1 hypothetical protein GCM10007352_22250 [Mucilaginibacter phyllosphaerae]